MNPDKWGLVLILTLVVVIGAIVVAQVWLRGAQVEVHQETNCPKDETNTYPSTAILIDRSDPITSSQKRYLISYMEDLKTNFSLFEKVAIYPIDSTGGVAPVPLFERCNPGTPEEANVWFENPGQIRETFEVGFAAPFNRAIEQSIADATTETSPIMETVQAVMSNHSLDAKITQQRLILISDMLQNTSPYSQYRDGYSYSDFLESGYASRTASNLTGVGVAIVYLWRPSLSPEDVDKHLLFWEEYFRQSGGALQNVYKVR